MKKIFSVFLFFMFIALLTACSFHLQGKKVLAPPLRHLYLKTSDPYGYLARSLEQILKMSDVTIVNSPEKADTTLVILQDSTNQQLLAPNGTLQTRQYNLQVVVSFEIMDKNGVIILSPQTLTEDRPITIQSNQILGSSNEISLYYQQMRRTLAYTIMNRIASTDVAQTIIHAFEVNRKKQ